MSQERVEGGQLKGGLVEREGECEKKRRTNLHGIPHLIPLVQPLHVQLDNPPHLLVNLLRVGCVDAGFGRLEGEGEEGSDLGSEGDEVVGRGGSSDDRGAERGEGRGSGGSVEGHRVFFWLGLGVYRLGL